MRIVKLSRKYINYLISIIQKRWRLSNTQAMVQAGYYLKNTNNSVCFIGLVDEKPMATAVFDKKQEDVDPSLSPWNTLLWVESRYRGKGYGQKLTKKRFEYAKKLGYKTIYLDTAESSDYHKKFGWKPVKWIKYKGEDDLIMKHEL